MEIELKEAIIKKVLENLNEFQLINFIREEFRAYIYDAKGDYLIGGEKVANFILGAVALIKN